MFGRVRLYLKKRMAGAERSTFITIAFVGFMLIVLVSISTGLPDNEIRVTSFDPTGRIDLRTNFTVKFTKAMVSKDSLDRPVLDPPIVFSPAIRGIARWVETDVLRFFPDGELLPATTYKVQVVSNKTWISGLKIINKDIYTFQTPELWVDVQGSTAPDGDQPGMVRLVATIRFNYPVNAAELKRSLTLEGTKAAPVRDLHFTLHPADRADIDISDDSVATMYKDFSGTQFVLTTDFVKQLPDPQTYTLTVASGLGCKDCGKPLASPFTKTLTIEAQRPLVVNSVYPEMRADGGVVRIYLSSMISAEAAKPFVTVDSVTDFTLEDEYTCLLIRGRFKPGATVTINIAAGLPSTSGATLEREFSTKVKFGDLPPSVAFTSRGVFLPRTGNGLLEFKTTNIDQVAVEVEQVFLNNLVYFLTSGYGGYTDYGNGPGNLGRTLLVREKTLDQAKNEPLLTTVDLKGIVGDSAKGIFKIAVRDKEQRWISDSRYAMITDIGISARLSDDYLMVWANSLTAAAPIRGATVALISRNNQTLVSGRTDARGIAVFDDIKSRLSGFEPFVITVTHDNDLAFLRLDETLLPISDFDVSGRPYLSSGYEAFIYSDRGVYRPGDTAHFISIVRGVEVSAPPAFPYFLTVYDNRGRKFTSTRMTTEPGAVGAHDFGIPDFAATGKYSIVAEIGENLQIGRAAFLVEDFMPDRIRVTVRTPAAEYKAGQAMSIGVDAKYLFGPPAAFHRVSGHLTIEPMDFAPAGWSQYSFVDPNRTFARMEIDLRDTLLNDTGGHLYTYAIPDKLLAPSTLKGLVSATVSEQGGRGVSAYGEVKIHPYRRYVGIRQSADGWAKINEPVQAEIVAVTPDGKAAPALRGDVRFYRIVYNTILKKDRLGIYRYQSERKEQLIDSARVELTGEAATVSFTPHEYGSYEIVAKDSEGGHSSAVTFYASGWGYAPWAMTNPDRIELQVDKKSYVVGDKALLQVRAPFGGKLLLTIEKGMALEMISRDMPDNTAQIEIPVRKEYFPNAYITAAILRPANSLEPNMPARAFGVCPIALSLDPKTIAITIDAPAVMKPKSTLAVKLKTSLRKESQVTLAAVDAGILQLTDFAAPDPLTFFYGKKQPGLKPYDLYSFLYPVAKQSTSHLGAGDKMFAASRRRHLNPITSKRVKPVALWSGLVKTDATGNASVTFSVPEFNGKLVLMAVGVQDDLFGSATKEVTVRDNIVLQESFPRFVSPNDVFEGLITIYNNTGARADIALTATANGPAEFVSPATTTISVDANREASTVFKIRAGLAPGKISFQITASTGNDSSSLNIELPNRPAIPLLTRHGSGVVTKGSPVEFTFPADWLPGTGQFVLKTSSMPAASFASHIQYLLSYPYGCVEQTTSRLFPLLYFNDLVKAAEPSLFGGRGHEYYIAEGILRLSSMFLPDKSFAYWPGTNQSNNWSTIYASHFLSEASKAGYFVDKKFLEQIYDHLRDMAVGKGDNNLTDVHRIYAALVLAQAGRMEQRVVTYLKRVDPTALPPCSRYQLAGALALSGNTLEAGRLVPIDVQPNLFEPETGGDFNSSVRTDAILLETMLAVDPNGPSTDLVAKSLMERARAGQWYTTQDNAFALMALGKYFKLKSAFGFTGSIRIEGDKSYTIDSTGFSLMRKDLAGKRVTVTVQSGDGTCFFYWQASGVPTDHSAPEFDHGMMVRREYLDEDARLVDLKNVRLGSRMVCVITAESTTKFLQNVVINDLLPAGFEIENPRLKTTPRLSWIPTQGGTIDYQDIRDDRLLIFTNLYPNGKVKFYYSLRAISGGLFKVPPVAAECMYNPLIGSSASSGTVLISR